MKNKKRKIKVRVRGQAGFWINLKPKYKSANGKKYMPL